MILATPNVKVKLEYSFSFGPGKKKGFCRLRQMINALYHIYDASDL